MAAGLGAMALLLFAWPSTHRGRVARSATTSPEAPAVGRRVLVAHWARVGARLARGCGRLGALVRRRLPRARTDPAADRAVGAAILAGLAVGFVLPLLAPPVALATWAAPKWRARRDRERARSAVVDEVPDVVEMFRLAAGAGLTPHLSLAAVATRAPPRCRVALVEVVEREHRGEPLADALDGLGARVEPLRPLAVALSGAERYGAALLPSLERVGVDARQIRRRRAEEAARALPVKLLFPLVLCILPAFGLLTVLPVLLASLPRLAA